MKDDWLVFPERWDRTREGELFGKNACERAASGSEAEIVEVMARIVVVAQLRCRDARGDARGDIGQRPYSGQACYSMRGETCLGL